MYSKTVSSWISETKLDWKVNDAVKELLKAGHEIINIQYRPTFLYYSAMIIYK